MNSLPISIKSIKQKHNYVFTIDWSDGVTLDYRLNHVQQRCPCAKCHEARSREGFQQENNDTVQALRLVSIGRYAMRIQFTAGCSAGIYSYAMLRQIGQTHEAL